MRCWPSSSSAAHRRREAEARPSKRQLMSFLAPILLFALPLAALPVIIHLIHLHRRRTIPWAATLFLRMAQKMNRGFSRIRQFLILAARVLAVLALIFVISRPLAGGWLGLTGGAPDTVLVLLDRSASMEQQNLSTGVSKRSAALTKMVEGIEDLFGSRTRVVLIDSASVQPIEISEVRALTDLPAARPSDTAADVPAMLQVALDYITRNQLGRTDVWIASDLRAQDWDAAGGRWEVLRAAFAQLDGVKFHALAFPDVAKDNLSVSVENVLRRQTAGKAEVLMDIRIRRAQPSPESTEVQVALVVNGARSTFTTMLKDDGAVVQGHSVPVDVQSKRGWGKVELPADTNLRDNSFHFVFDAPAVPLSVIVSDDAATHGPARAVLSSPAEAGRKQEVQVISPARTSEIDWEKTAFIVWQAEIPPEQDVMHQQLLQHVLEGRSLLFLPPSSQATNGSSFRGLSWGEWQAVEKEDNRPVVEWWRTTDGLLANSRSGQALPVGELEVQRLRQIKGDGAEVLRLANGGSLVVQAADEARGFTAFLGALPGSADSSLARDGVVWYAMLQRAVAEGAKALGNAQQRDAASAALSADITWKPVGAAVSTVESADGLTAGVFESGERRVALNRPASEDSVEVVSDEALASLFAGLAFHRVDDSVESERDLANEVWRTFLWLMALAIVLEALLCLPQRPVNATTGREAMT
jgi:hypothetical protein